MSPRALAIGIVTVATAVLAYVMFIALPGMTTKASVRRTAALPPVSVPAAPGRKIKAHLFYVGDDGTRLSSVERDVTYGDTAVDQAREIIAAQIAPVSEPLVSAIPPGTTLRAVFITDRGEAYVDLSRELSSAHPGGTVEELLTVYTLVHALTENLPAVTAVQVLVDGKEVETLAGHVDLRRPLPKNPAWVQ
jgi:spore germination protein GerM